MNGGSLNPFVVNSFGFRPQRFPDKDRQRLFVDGRLVSCDSPPGKRGQSQKRLGKGIEQNGSLCFSPFFRSLSTSFNRPTFRRILPPRRDDFYRIENETRDFVNIVWTSIADHCLINLFATFVQRRRKKTAAPSVTLE